MGARAGTGNAVAQVGRGHVGLEWGGRGHGARVRGRGVWGPEWGQGTQGPEGVGGM